MEGRQAEQRARKVGKEDVPCDGRGGPETRGSAGGREKRPGRAVGRLLLITGLLLHSNHRAVGATVLSNDID